MRRLSPRGFTLIELMITIVIIGLLAAIATPNLISMQDRAKEAAVKSNCRLISRMAEDLAIQNNGVYPAAIAPFLPLLPGNVLLVNPFTKVRSEPILGAAPARGETAYEPTMFAGVPVGYTVRGGGNAAQLVIAISNGN